MDTQTVQQHIIDGFTAFKTRIKPARVAETEKNGRILGDWVKAQGFDIATMTAQEISDVLFRAASQDENLVAVEWVVKPTKLKLREEKGVRKIFEAGSQLDFAAKVRASETSDADSKVAAKAAQYTRGIIENFQLNSARKTTDFQAKLHKRVERLKNGGVKWEDIQTDIAGKISELHTAEERESEFSSGHRDLLNKVEV